MPKTLLQISTNAMPISFDRPRYSGAFSGGKLRMALPVLLNSDHSQQTMAISWRIVSPFMVRLVSQPNYPCLLSKALVQGAVVLRIPPASSAWIPLPSHFQLRLSATHFSTELPEFELVAAREWFPLPTT